MSERTVNDAVRVQKHGVPELVQAVKNGTVAVSDAANVVGYRPDIQQDAVQCVQKGLASTAAEVATLPCDGRRCLRNDDITITAARSLLPLAVYNRVATTSGPFHDMGFEEGIFLSHATWYDHIAKLILWRPRLARGDDEVAHEVESTLFDLFEVERLYGGLPQEEADALAEQNSQDEHMDLAPAGLVSPDYWWAKLWLWMKPDFIHLAPATAK